MVHHGTSHHRSQAVRAHHASPTSAALAAILQTTGFQDIHPCLSFVVWHRSCVPSWRMYAGYRRWPPSSAVCWQSNVLSQEITQPVRWLLFLPPPGQRCETLCLNSFGNRTYYLRTIQTIVENVYVWLVGPRRPVCNVKGADYKYSYLLTYLLTYFIEYFTSVKSWDKCCTVMLCEAVIVCYSAPSTTSTSETYKIPNCKGRLCKIHWIYHK